MDSFFHCPDASWTHSLHMIYEYTILTILLPRKVADLYRIFARDTSRFREAFITQSIWRHFPQSLALHNVKADPWGKSWGGAHVLTQPFPAVANDIGSWIYFSNSYAGHRLNLWGLQQILPRYAALAEMTRTTRFCPLRSLFLAVAIRDLGPHEW